MTIRKRLQLTGLIPILLLFIGAGYFLITSYINYEKASAFKNALANNALLTDTLVKLGKERSVTALYLSSHKKKYSSTLSKQRTLLDDSYQVLETKLQKKIPTYIPQLLEFIDPLPSQPSNAYETLITNQPLSPAIRRAVDTKTFDFRKIFLKLYTDKLTKPILESIDTIHYYAINPEITSLIHTSLALHIAQEYSSLELGFISYFLEQKAPTTLEDKLLWETFQRKSNSYDISKISPETLKQDITQILEDKNAQNLFKDIVHARTSVKLHLADGEYTQSAISWFTLHTNKIALLTEAQLLISNTLSTKINSILKTQLILLALSALLVLFTIFLAYKGYKTQKDISQNIYTLENILNHTVQKVKKEDIILNPELETIKSINLETTEGTKEVYKFLQILVETTKENRHTAISENKPKTLFPANMSHEVLIPLNGILEYTQMLRDTNLDNKQSKFLSTIDKNSENLLRIINNSLDLSKIENHKIEIENIIFDAYKEFENPIETYAVTAAEKNIDLHYYMDPTISRTLKGDPHKIKEVLTNLLSNAVKFSREGGEVNLDITKDEPNYITFTIKDNSINTPKDKQAHIVNDFSQPDTSVTRKYGGIGLEFTISNKFVEIMNGILTVDNSHEEGRTFSFTLPLEELSTEETSKKDNYSNHTIALYTKDISTKFKSNLKHSLKYFKSYAKEFESQKELQLLKESQECQSYWIDIDKADKDILKSIQNIDITKLFILVNATSREKIKKLGLENHNIVYKPLTLTKIEKILTKVEESKETQSVKYSAHTINKKANAHLELLDLSLPTESIETQNTVVPKILIAKHFLLERRILIKVIENLELAYEIFTDESLETVLKEEKYDIVFTDEKYITEKISGRYPNISIITESKTKDEIISLVSKKRI